MILYLTLSLSNNNTFCWLMRLFLSNSGSLMSWIVTNTCVLRQPARVLTSLVSPSNFVITPFGKADLLIIETFEPESKSTQKSLHLLMVPIVSTVVQMGNLDLWPMVIESRCVILNLITFIFISCGCIPSRGIGVLGERYVQCEEGLLPLNSHCLHHIRELLHDN